MADGDRRVAAPAFVAADVGLAVGLPLLALIAWLTPQALWPSLAAALAPAAGGIVGRARHDVITRIRAVTGGRPLPVAAETIARQLVAAEIENGLHTMRDHLPWRWNPEIELVGGEHIEAALAAGRGAIIWDSHFYFASSVTKMGLKRAGFEVIHLSHPRHGYSPSRFGMRWLNPLRTAHEARHVAERVVLSTDASLAALRTLLKRLTDNRVVSVTVRSTGLRPTLAPFLDGHVSLATGAPDMAYATGAALIPVFTVRRGTAYTITAEAPIDVPRDMERHAAAHAAARAYATRLEPWVLAHPGQWVEWLNI